MTETITERAETLKEEARGLQDALRPLLGVEALGELTEEEHARKERIQARLAALREDADDIGQRQRASHAERKSAAREAEERRLREAGEERSRHEREQTLRREIIAARYEQLNPRVGINVGGQPKGAAHIVAAANRVEDTLAIMYDERAIELFGVPARWVRSLADDAAWGIRIKPGSGEIEAGVAPSPEALVRSPVPTPHQDWSGPAAPHFDTPLPGGPLRMRGGL